MKIKVQCPCGSRFEFEAEPVGGLMPVAVHCPNCGEDATELANTVIQEQSSPGLPGGKPRVALRMSDAASVPPTGTAGHPAGAASDSVAPAAAPIPDPNAEPSTDSTTTVLCPKHPGQPAIETCRVCGKPICLKCMELFGYICSVFCRNQALERRLNIPVCPHQKSVQVEKEFQALKRGLAAGVVVIVFVAAFWVWYVWFGVMPKVVYSVKFPETTAAGRFDELAAPGRLLSIVGNQLSVYDLRAGRPAWSAALDAPVWKEPGRGLDLGEAVVGGKLYLLAGPRLSTFDLETGRRREIAVLKTPVTGFSRDERSIVIVSEPEGERAVVTRAALDSGAVETEEAPPAASPGKPGGSPKPAPRAPVSSETGKPGQPEPARDEFLAAGASVLEMKVKLLQAKVIQVVTMKPKGASVLDSSSLNASQGSELAAEMASDAQRQRGGGVRARDESLYQVVFHRWFAQEAADWTGEVTGPPELFSLKTLDLLVSGNRLQVFDKNNKLLWESQLTYPIRDRNGGDEDRRRPPPCLEEGGSLYLADQGMLTSFDPATGSVHWRLTTVGISGIQFDEQGKLYLDTTTSDPEYIQYPDDPALRKKAQPLILKVEPATGTLLWRSQSFSSGNFTFIPTGSRCLLSGKYVYAARVSRALGLLHMGEGEKFDFNLYRLDPADGAELWRYYQLNRGLDVEARKNWILARFPDQIQVLSFFSF